MFYLSIKQTLIFSLLQYPNVTCYLSASCQVAHKASTLCLHMSLLCAESSLLPMCSILLLSFLSLQCVAMLSLVDHVSFYLLGTMSMLSHSHCHSLFSKYARCIAISCASSHRSSSPILLSPKLPRC